MPRYTANKGGVFGSGLYPDSRPQIDAGGLVDSLARGATSLIQQAYMRRQVQDAKKLQDAERTRQHTREDRQDVMAEESHAAELAAKGYTPAHDETTSTLEPGSVQSGGLTGKGSVTAPRVTQKTSRIQAAYDPNNTPAMRKATADRQRKSGEFAAVYQRQFPRSTPDEARAAGEYAADNASIADNLLFPKPDAWTQFKQQWDYEGAHPHRQARDGSANSGIGLALRTTSAQVDDARSDLGQARGAMKQEFPDGPPDQYDLERDPAVGTRYRELLSRDSSMTARADSVGKIRDAYARQQQDEAGLTGSVKPKGPAGPAAGPTNPHAAEEATLAKQASAALAAGADPEKVNERLRERLTALRKKK